ncbi:MAG: hypothetical protein WA610_00450 [Thermodesulfovibrionales bacterium]
MSRFGIVFISLGLFGLSFLAIENLRDSGSPVSGVAYAQEEWRKEFDDICGKTQDAMIFNPEELKSLVTRCDKIRPLIEKLDETQRKVYLRRLQMCRDLFSFALESKEKK